MSTDNFLTEYKRQTDNKKIMNEIKNLIEYNLTKESTVEEYEKILKQKEKYLIGIVELPDWWEEWKHNNMIKKIAEEEKKGHILDIATKLANNTGFISGARQFHQENPFMYDKRKLWFLWNQTKTIYELVDETDMLIIIRKALQLLSDTSIKKKFHIVESLRQIGREHNVTELPPHYIQFQNKIYNMKNNTIIPATPEHFTTNTIPHNIGETIDTPTMDRLFEQWVGKERVQTLYDIIAYCCYRDYPIHSIFVLNGCGRNGKSSFLELVTKFIGQDNIASTTLDRLTDNRFETFNLWRKNVAMMGETNFSILQSTSLIKQLSGHDLITYEAKGVSGFSDYNYAKLIISTNSLPTSDDQSEGFYRRWMIIDFPNEFPEGTNIINSIPDIEYENLARKVCDLIVGLIRRGSFTGQGTITERKERYIEASNPISGFIKDVCVKDENSIISYSKLYTAYVQWLQTKKKRTVKTKEFSRSLEDHGLEKRKTSFQENGMWINGWMISGLKFKEKLKDYVTDVTDVTALSLAPIIGNLQRNETTVTLVTSVTDDDSFISKRAVLREINNVTKISYVDLLKLYPNLPEFDKWIFELKNEGLIYENPNGILNIVK